VNTVVVLLTLICVGMIWLFAGIFSFPFWKFLMGILAGFIIKFVMDSRNEKN